MYSFGGIVSYTIGNNNWCHFLHKSIHFIRSTVDKSLKTIDKSSSGRFVVNVIIISLMSNLPFELLSIIFDHLSFHDCTKCILVCKRWHQLLLPRVYETISSRMENVFDFDSINGIIDLKCLLCIDTVDSLDCPTLKYHPIRSNHLIRTLENTDYGKYIKSFIVDDTQFISRSHPWRNLEILVKHSPNLSGINIVYEDHDFINESPSHLFRLVPSSVTHLSIHLYNQVSDQDLVSQHQRAFNADLIGLLPRLSLSSFCFELIHGEFTSPETLH
jgi:hypothetical protein